MEPTPNVNYVSLLMQLERELRRWAFTAARSATNTLDITVAAAASDQALETRKATQPAIAIAKM